MGTEPVMRWDDEAKVADTSARPGLAVRLCAQRLLGAVIDTATPLDGLTDETNGHPQYRALDARDRSLVRAILSSALRHRNTIEAFLVTLYDRALPANAKSLQHLLHDCGWSNFSSSSDFGN